MSVVPVCTGRGQVVAAIEHGIGQTCEGIGGADAVEVIPASNATGLVRTTIAQRAGSDETVRRAPSVARLRGTEADGLSRSEVVVHDMGTCVGGGSRTSVHAERDNILVGEVRWRVGGTHAVVIVHAIGGNPGLQAGSDTVIELRAAEIVVVLARSHGQSDHWDRSTGADSEEYV
jgi:hypothetical protein